VTFANVPDGVWVTSVFPSGRDPNTVFVSLNNWQRGDYKPYLVKSTDRGRTFTSIAGDLPDRFDVWSVVQDHVNGNLLFAGTEFGLFFTVDGGSHWTQLKGMPVAQVRDIKIQKRENDLVLATFGRGFYVLDDYSAFRDMSAQALSQEAALFPLRNPYQFDELGYIRAVQGNEATPNPPMGAVFTYAVGSSVSANLALTVADAVGKQVYRADVPRTPGVHRVTWNLRVPAPPGAAAAGGRGGRGGAAGGRGAAVAGGAPAGAGATGAAAAPARGAAAGAAGAGAGAGGGAGAAGAGAAAVEPPPDAPAAPQGGGGRGGGGGGVFVPPGKFTATLNTVDGDKLTPIGKPQTFTVVPLPKKNY